MVALIKQWQYGGGSSNSNMVAHDGSLDQTMAIWRRHRSSIGNMARSIKQRQYGGGIDQATAAEPIKDYQFYQFVKKKIINCQIDF
jgi:hypothetical protein